MELPGARPVTPITRILAEVQNIGEAAEEELGYVKSILRAIEMMATDDPHHYKIEIASLAKCAHWIADNLESNVDHMGGEIINVSREIH
jgi:hypothetical protein